MFSYQYFLFTVSTIPPMLHTHSFTYHPRYIMFLSQYLFSHVSTIPPMLHTHSFTYHPRYIMFLSEYLFSPVSTIPPMLHTHSFTYHPRYIMFLSQYFSFPCQYHSTNAPYPFIHLPPTLYNVSLPELQFSPVSTIPPMLHTHSFTNHPRYIRFLSQNFSFPLSVPFHQCSIPIHSPTTHTI